MDQCGQTLICNMFLRLPLYVIYVFQDFRYAFSVDYALTYLGSGCDPVTHVLYE